MGTAQPAQDDIVTRLRALVDVGSWVPLSDWDSTTKEAADEIEELRATVRELRSEVQRLTYA